MNPPAPTLDGRLLCACNCTYSVAGNGTLPPGTPAPWYDGAGFQQPPVAFVGGPQNIHACLVGSTSDGVVLAFRGTFPINKPGLDTLLDWFNDFSAVPVRGADLPGLVHEGFLSALTSLWDRALAEVKKQAAAAGPNTTVFVTGHSKGGGIAPLAAWRLINKEGLSAKVVTIAAPKAGNADFADAYNSGRIAHTRYEYADDIVPHLPPGGLFTKVLRVLATRDPRFTKFTTLAYDAVGTLRFIDWSGHIVGDSLELALKRVISMLTQIGSFQEDAIVADHLIDCGDGYTNAICPSGVCP
jgi:triacylglycerol lipase